MIKLTGAIVLIFCLAAGVAWVMTIFFRGLINDIEEPEEDDDIEHFLAELEDEAIGEPDIGQFDREKKA